MSERCIIEITVSRPATFNDDDIVKQVWSFMAEFFTRHHGLVSGQMWPVDNVSIKWRIESIDAALSEGQEP